MTKKKEVAKKVVKKEKVVQEKRPEAVIVDGVNPYDV